MNTSAKRVARRFLASVQWDTTTEETYTFLAYAFDVRRAKEILVAKRHRLDNFDPSQWEDLAKRHIGVNPTNVDLTVPVFFATPKKGVYLPIDGWNRIRKAIKEGVTELPAVMLNFKETQTILI